MRVEDFELKVKELLQTSKDKAIAEKHFEINYESQYKSKFLQIIADNVLIFGQGETWLQAFEQALSNLESEVSK